MNLAIQVSVACFGRELKQVVLGAQLGLVPSLVQVLHVGYHLHALLGTGAHLFDRRVQARDCTPQSYRLFARIFKALGTYQIGIKKKVY